MCAYFQELDVTQRIVELLIVYGDQVNEKVSNWAK